MPQKISAELAELFRRLSEALAKLNPEENNNLLTVAEVASRLRVKPDYVYRLERRGDIPSVRIGRKIRFRSSDIDKYLKRASHHAP